MIWLAASVACAGQAPDLYLHHLTLASGLSQSINAFVYRDHQGFMWISSMDGVNRYDGTSVKVYRPRADDNTAMKGKNIQSPFFEDEDGDIWFGTNEAINCYRRATDDFVYFQCPGDSGKALVARYYVFYRRANSLWFRAGDKFFAADWKALKRGVSPDSCFRVLGSAPESAIRCFVRPSMKEQWGLDIFVTAYGSIPGLLHYFFDGDSIRQAGQKNFRDEKANITNWALPDGGDTVWVATAKGLMLYRTGNGTFSFPGGNGTLRLNESVRCVVPWGRRYLFVSAKSGLYLFDKQDGAYVRRYRHNKEESTSLADDLVWELYLDKTETLWISIWFKGLDFVNLRKHKFERIQISVPNSDGSGNSVFVPKTMAEGVEGNLWLGSNTNGLLRTDKNMRPLAYQAVRQSNVEKILRNYDGNMWTRSGGGEVRCYRRINETWREMLVKNVSQSSFNWMGLVRSGEVWMVDEETEKYYYAQRTGNGWKILPVQLAGISNIKAGPSFEDSEGNLWVSENQEAIIKLKHSESGYGRAGKIPISGRVLCFAESPGTVWVTGYFGLLRIPKNAPDSARLYTESDGLPNQTVYAAVSDADGELWLTTNKGIARFMPQLDSFRVYGLADGLQDLEFNENAFLRLSDGRILFGGVGGFNLFHPDSIRDIPWLPEIRITSLLINDQPDTLHRNITLADSLEFGWRDNTLSFRFVAMEYSDPANNKLLYKLDFANHKPYDASWVECIASNGFARYANLPPGEYVLNIRGANSDGVWNPEPRRLYIKIRPPFWETWWFKALCLMALACAIYAGLRIYIGTKLREKNLQLREQRLQIEKQDALTQERNRIAGEMHDDLGGGLTSIRMLSSRVQKKVKNPDIQIQVDKIAQYSQELVQKMGEIIWAMNSNFDTVENLVAYIRRYTVDFLEVSGLRYHIREPETMPDYAISGERRRNIYLAVKESLHNVVKHANAERVSISFEIADEQLVVHVQDDGKGIDLEQVNQFGNGLYNMRKRLRDIGGEMLVENTDGTMLTFIVPLEKTSPP